MEPFLIRDLHLHGVSDFSRALAASFASSSAAVQKALGEALYAECVVCGISVNGKELMEVCAVDPEAGDDNKLKRLRLGYCARKGCNSYNYKLKFYRHIDLNWNEALPQIDDHVKRDECNSAQATELVTSVARSERLKLTRKAGIVLAVVVLLFVLRQWYAGGSIPLIRQAEKFRVDPNPAAAREEVQF